MTRSMLLSASLAVVVNHANIKVTYQHAPAADSHHRLINY